MIHRRHIELALAKKRAARSVVKASYRETLSCLVRALSPRQRQFYDDESQEQCTVATRQSGKSSGALLKLSKMVFGRPGSISYVLMPTRDIVRDTFWDRWKEQSALFGLTDDHHHETNLETRAPNGSIARFIGVKDKKRADRVRGQTADLIIIDEAATFADDLLQYLVEDCCDAALGIKQGQLIVTSTPGMDPSGYLFRAYTDPALNYSRHFLSTFDNPAWKDPEAYLARVRQKNGYTEKTPKYAREWLGQWVSDFESRVYRIDDANLIDAPDAFDFSVMAVDLGAVDESAFCVLGWKHGSRVLQVLHEEAEGEIDLTSVAERIKDLQERFRPLVTMVDGAAKQSVLEIQNRHGIPLEATPKANNYKPKAIAQLNADLRRGMLQIPRHFPLVGQARALQWAKNAKGVRENPGQPNDRCDALLYAHMRATHYTEQTVAPPPPPGSVEALRIEQEAIREAHIAASSPKDAFDPFSDDYSDPF